MMNREPITRKQVMSLSNVLGMGAILLDLGDVDYSRGRVAISDLEHHMWTIEGHRIEVSIFDTGGFAATQTREADEDRPEPIY